MTKYDADRFHRAYTNEFGYIYLPDGIRYLVSKINVDTRWTDLKWVAYFLATTSWETGRKFEPVSENGSDEYFSRYDAPHPVAQRLGNTNPGDGLRFKGRGYVQITGRGNYERISRYIGVDIVQSPALALTRDLAYEIAVRGMIHGWFSGKKLADYIDGTKTDYLNARQIINGHDHAAEIAQIAEKMETCLHQSTIQ